MLTGWGFSLLLAVIGISMEVLAGTSGYSYQEWKGAFYPGELPAGEMLRFYGQRFSTVEINNTFYRMPGEAMLERWREEVPDYFAFSLKAPRRITHEKRLREAEPDVVEFMRRASVLGSKLAVVLFQLPPFFRKDVSRLADFLESVGTDRAVAVEFRHSSWQDDSVYDTLRAHRATLCLADTDEGEPPLIATSELGYLRLRRAQYDDRDLIAWIERIAKQPWQRAYVYFKHEDEALGPRFAQRFTELWRTGSELG